MESSCLNRRLLYCGQSEMNDFLKDSPLNRFLYEKLLGVFSASGIDVPAVVLFNEIYYQCVRVNYDRRLVAKDLEGGDMLLFAFHH